LSAWLKEQANDLPPLEETLQPVECKKIPMLDVDELWSFVFKTLSFSKCVKMHEICLKPFIHRYNTELLSIVG